MKLLTYLSTLASTMTVGNKTTAKATTKDGSTNVAEFLDSDGTMVQKIDSLGFGNVFYRDEYPSGIWTNAAGAAAPDIVGYTIGGVGVNRDAFDGGTIEEKKSNTFEIPHDIDIDAVNDGTKVIEVHVHWRPASSTATGQVKWFFDWSYSAYLGDPIAMTSLSCKRNLTTATQFRHYIDQFTDGSSVVKLEIPVGGFDIGGLILFNIRRKPTDAEDDYTADVILEQVALHIPVNSDGSRTIFNK